jgi:hypothetical protein
MSSELFARLLQFEEQWKRSAPRYGLLFAKVLAITPDGIELDYLSSAMEAPSVPARLATPMAGAGRGVFFHPEVGDEVVVGFELGDANRPVVLGALWNEAAAPPPPADLGPSNNVRTIVSRAGHQITFDDTPGSGAIQIRTSGGFEIKLDTGGVTITTTGVGASSRIVLDGINWGTHVHPTGTGPSGPPQPGSL